MRQSSLFVICLALVGLTESPAPCQTLDWPRPPHHANAATVLPPVRIDTIAFAALPAEAQRVAFALHHHIHNTPHFFHDGAIFYNDEGQLPPHRVGYYHEYTVPTPGLHERGARRVIVGGAPPRVWYYTANHYRTFQRFQIP